MLFYKIFCSSILLVTLTSGARWSGGGFRSSGSRFSSGSRYGGSSSRRWSGGTSSGTSRWSSSSSRGIGGSSYRASYSNPSSRSFRMQSYSSRSGSKSFFRAGNLVKGAVAYLAFRSLANMAFGHNHYDYRSRYSSVNGHYCTNNVNFNGTKFGRFRCPLNSFKASDIYCCGPGGEQYCCSFTDSTTRIVLLILGIVCAIGIIGGCIYCCMKMKKKRSNDSNDTPSQQYTMHQFPMQHQETYKDDSYTKMAMPPTNQNFYVPSQVQQQPTVSYPPQQPNGINMLMNPYGQTNNNNNDQPPPYTATS
ncbi:hypothetical protein SNEBB_009773 [Seison nebaliae]|nr:hypothetical protein SNEBB_009773 [Seison nebaliae]